MALLQRIKTKRGFIQDLNGNLKKLSYGTTGEDLFTL